VRLFWMAWSFAVCLVLLGLGLTAWVFASSGHLPDVVQERLKLAARALAPSRFAN
jgi:hypothetical protein